MEASTTEQHTETEHRIHYALIRTFWHIDGRYSKEETERRLQEVRDCFYTYSPRCMSIKAVTEIKSTKLTATQQAYLDDFPAQGMYLGNASKALLFADTLAKLPLNRHKVIVKLVALGYLGIVEGVRQEQKSPQSDIIKTYHVQVLVRIK